MRRLLICLGMLALMLALLVMLTLQLLSLKTLFVDGRLAPNLEIGNDKLRNSALQKVGKKRWNKRLIKFIKRLDETFHFKKLYIGGGNSKEVDVSLLPANVTLISNLNGLVGGIALWREEPPLTVSAATTEGNGHPLAA